MITTTLACADYLHLEEDIRALDRAGSDWFHIDIMDGHFVPNLCLNFDIVRAIRTISETPMDVHLMVNNPLKYVEVMAKSGVEAACTHLNTDDSVHEFLEALEEHGIRKGIALAPGDPAEAAIPFLSKIDFVLLLFVNPGFSGQQFQPEVLKKLEVIAAARKVCDRQFIIAADGGVSFENAGELIGRGADMLVAGAFANYDGRAPLYERTKEFCKVCKDLQELYGGQISDKDRRKV